MGHDHHHHHHGPPTKADKLVIVGAVMTGVLWPEREAPATDDESSTHGRG